MAALPAPPFAPRRRGDGARGAADPPHPLARRPREEWAWREGPAGRKGGGRAGGGAGPGRQSRLPAPGAASAAGKRGGAGGRGHSEALPPSPPLPRSFLHLPSLPAACGAPFLGGGGGGVGISGVFLWFLSPFSFLSDGDARSSCPALPAAWRGAAGASPSGALGGGLSPRALQGRVRAVPGPVCDPKFCSWNGGQGRYVLTEVVGVRGAVVKGMDGVGLACLG